MKTIKELKIGDTVYLVKDNEIKESKVMSLTLKKDDKIFIYYNDSRFNIDNTIDLNETSHFGNKYNGIVFLNKSEAIIQLKSNLLQMLEKQLNKLNEIKDQIAKYL